MARVPGVEEQDLISWSLGMASRLLAFIREAKAALSSNDVPWLSRWKIRKAWYPISPSQFLITLATFIDGDLSDETRDRRIDGNLERLPFH